MSARPGSLKTEQLDMDSLFDFSGTTSTTQPSPALASSSKLDSTPKTTPQDWSAVSPYDTEQRQQFSGPSHDYNQYRQQVGLPMGSIANIPSQSMYDQYPSAMTDVAFDAGYGGGWSSGIDMDSEMTVDFNNPASAMPAMFFPAQDTTPHNADNFIDPSNIAGQEEPTSNVGRLWPGMHSQQAQQAAMQKASQVQAVQQRQQKIQAQQAQYRVASNTQTPAQPTASHSKRPSHVSDPHVEESISRLLNQMRHNSTVSNDDDDDENSNMPHLARMKKDEDDMDEDERLLASEEGKKLSSKERRQLRNKVSARAFRSRRKEYIGQLEGEVALKTQEANNLRSQNAALMQENDSYRGLIETLLRHPSFTPFINDLSQDPSALLALQQRPQQAPQQQQQQQQQQAPQQHQRRPSATPAQQPAQPQQQQQQQSTQQDPKPDYLNFDASQLQLPGQQQQQTERVNLAVIPENDFSKLNLNGFATMNFNNYRVNAFAVTSLPAGPDPLDLLCLDGDSTNYVDALSEGVCDSNVSALLARLDGAARRVQE